MKKRFTVGSTYFFKKYPDFKGHDIDLVEFEENPTEYKTYMQSRRKAASEDLFRWRKMTADEFIEYSLQTRFPMDVGKFLVPEVCEYIGFTFEHLKRLESVFRRIDPKHRYEELIFDFYIENGGFFLTDDQRFQAYMKYKEYRRRENETIE